MISLPDFLYLVRESQFFIEWLVSGLDLEVDLEAAVDLVDLQWVLGRWKLEWEVLGSSEVMRQEMAAVAAEWCDRLEHQQRQVWAG